MIPSYQLISSSSACLLAGCKPTK